MSIFGCKFEFFGSPKGFLSTLNFVDATVIMREIFLNSLAS